MDVYIADLRAATRQDKSLKIIPMNRLGIPQDRIAKRLGIDQKTIHNHLGKMPVLANLLNADLVIFDPPYFDKKADGYGEKSLSGLQRKDH